MGICCWIPSSRVSEPLLVVGDVHGDAERLKELLRQTAAKQRRIVFVGDYVNRGPASRDVLETLVEARRAMGEHIVLLAGNHEVALLYYLDTGDFVSFARHGGGATVRSYVGTAHGDVHGQLQRALPAAHEDLLRNGLVLYYENESVFISHAGFDPSKPDDRSVASMTLGHPELFTPVGRAAQPRPLIVCGHYVQRDQRPFDVSGLICLDTGCGTLGGPLNALLLPERKFVVV
jgi:serine/threonine protein phosphatase 1